MDTLTLALLTVLVMGIGAGIYFYISEKGTRAHLRK